MPSADFCSAVRPPFDNLSRRSDTKQISWGKLNRLLCTAAGSTLRTLDGYGLRGKLPARPALAPNIRFFVHRLAHLIHASFRPRLAAAALASSLGLHLHQAGRRTFTSKLLSMPSTQLSRWRGGRCAYAKVCSGMWNPETVGHKEVRDPTSKKGDRGTRAP